VKLVAGNRNWDVLPVGKCVWDDYFMVVTDLWLRALINIVACFRDAVTAEAIESSSNAIAQQ
jgi:hypothetical protein